MKTELKDYLPQGAFSQIAKWIEELDVVVTISKARDTKLGDFRPSRNGKCRVSVNNNLNKYAFLITLTHELAHAFVWKKYQNNVKSHGEEWKNMFKSMMLHFMDNTIFPEDVLGVLSKHLINPKASSSSDTALSMVLSYYDKERKEIIADLPFGSTFQLVNGKQLIKGEQLRTRFKCKELHSHRTYLIHPLAEVALLDNK